MSDPMQATEETRQEPCSLCGLTVTARKYVGVFTGKEWWHVETKHRAPCGAPCFGGGGMWEESLELYKAGQMHGTHRGPCPGCGEVRSPPSPLPDRDFGGEP